VDEGVVEVEDEGDLPRHGHATQGIRPGTREVFVRVAARDPIRVEVPVIEAGQPAPAFALPDETGRTVRLAEFAGRRVVLWFYVRDDTPG